jgi:hypothetical protein
MSNTKLKRKSDGTPESSPVGKGGGGNAGLSHPMKMALSDDPAESNITSIDEARAFLKEQGLLLEGEMMQMTNTLVALRMLAAMPNKTLQLLTDGLWSIYYAIKQADDAGTFVKMPGEDSHTLQELETQRSMLVKMEDMIGKMVTESREEIKEVRKELEETKKGVESITASTMGTMGHDIPDHTRPHAGPAARKWTGPSYAAPASQVATQHASTIAKGNDRECQIIITFKSDPSKSQMLKLSPKELVAKGDIALELMAKDGVEVPKGVGFVHATTTRSRAIIFQINSKSAADWLKGRDNLESFTARFGDTSGALAQARLFSVLVKFVPVSFVPEDQLSCNLVETNNFLLTDSIIHTRYIKAPERRSLNQQMAHVIMGFKTRELANQVIEHGLIIENKKQGPRSSSPNPANVSTARVLGVITEQQTARKWLPPVLDAPGCTGRLNAPTWGPHIASIAKWKDTWHQSAPAPHLKAVFFAHAGWLQMPITSFTP